MEPVSRMLALPQADATRQLGRLLGQQLWAGCIVLLDGVIGAGKTTLVQGLGEGLGIYEAIDSPTFTLINEYLVGRLPLYHMDLYRLSPAETSQLYLDMYWEGEEVPLGVVAIEWPERLPRGLHEAMLTNITNANFSGNDVSVLDVSVLTILLQATEAGGRTATLTATTPKLATLLENLAHHELLADEV